MSGHRRVAAAIQLAVPLHNFGVSQHIKTWMDLIITDPRGDRPEHANAGRVGRAREAGKALSALGAAVAVGAAPAGSQP